MVVGPHSFKRLVLGLQPRSADRTVRLAVELAEFLHLELLGLFLEDTSLRSLASIPFAREFRPLGGGWHPIDIDRLSYDLELAVRSAERIFVEEAKRLPTRSQFEVIRGSTTETIASISRSGDIVMIAEPVSPAERATQQFSLLIEAAFRSVAAVLLVPTHIARTTGPIVAIATSPDDPSIDAAAGIAHVAKEDLVIVEAYEGDLGVRELAADADLTIRHIAADNIPISDLAVFSSAFRQLQERLVVMTRGVFENELASSIAAARCVPVLVIEDTRGGSSGPLEKTES